MAGRQLNVRVSDELHGLLERAARATGSSVQDVVERALRGVLNEMQKQNRFTVTASKLEADVDRYLKMAGEITKGYEPPVVLRDGD